MWKRNSCYLKRLSCKHRSCKLSLYWNKIDNVSFVFKVRFYSVLIISSAIRKVRWSTKLSNYQNEKIILYKVHKCVMVEDWLYIFLSVYLFISIDFFFLLLFVFFRTYIVAFSFFFRVCFVCSQILFFFSFFSYLFVCLFVYVCLSCLNVVRSRCFFFNKQQQ